MGSPHPPLINMAGIIKVNILQFVNTLVNIKHFSVCELIKTSNLCCIFGVLSILMSTAFNFWHPNRFQASLITTFFVIFDILKYIQNNLYFLNVQSTCSKSCTL